MHPVRTAKNAVTPRSIKQVKRAAYTITNPLGAAENALIGSVLYAGSGKRTRKSQARRAPTGGTATSAASYAPSVSQLRAAEAVRAHDELADLMAVQRQRFAPAVKPQLPAPQRRDPAKFEAQGWLARKHEARWWQKARRRGIRAQVTAAARSHVEELFAAEWYAAQAQHQRVDAWWSALHSGQADVVGSALTAAFADNPARVFISDVQPRQVLIGVFLPGSEVIPTRQPYVTPGGKLSSNQWTQTVFNDTYADLLGAHLLATLRETWAVAPSIDTVCAVGLLSNTESLRVAFDVTATRGSGPWQEDTAGRALLDQAPLGLNRTGRTHAVTAWPRSALAPDIAQWVPN